MDGLSFVQVDVTPPDFETRMAIVKKKADMLDLQLSDNVVRIIAEKIKTNIRQLACNGLYIVYQR